MKNKNRLYKYRLMFAWGKTEWCMVEIPPYVKNIGEYLDEKCGNDSDKYRGVQFRRLEKIPEGYVKRKIEELNGTIQWAWGETDRLKKLKTFKEKTDCRTCARYKCGVFQKKECKNHGKWKAIY